MDLPYLTNWEADIMAVLADRRPRGSTQVCRSLNLRGRRVQPPTVSVRLRQMVARGLLVMELRTTNRPIYTIHPDYLPAVAPGLVAGLLDLLDRQHPNELHAWLVAHGWTPPPGCRRGS